jgi:hypothetical protein
LLTEWLHHNILIFMYVDNVKLSRFPLFLLNTSIQIRFWWKSFFFFWNYKRSYISFTFYIDRHGPKLNSQFLAIFSQKKSSFPPILWASASIYSLYFYIVSAYPRFFIWYISTKYISWEIQIYLKFSNFPRFILPQNDSFPIISSKPIFHICF